jgi:hypothetical protein
VSVGDGFEIFKNSSWRRFGQSLRPQLTLVAKPTDTDTGTDYCFYPCRSKRAGASTQSFTRTKKVTASLPSTTRWS